MSMKLIGAAFLVVSFLVSPLWGADSQQADQKIDVNSLTCKELMAGNDSDREVGIALFFGFLAGKKNNPILDVNATAAQTDKVRDYCLSNPNSTVMEAFQKAAN